MKVWNHAKLSVQTSHKGNFKFVLASMGLTVKFGELGILDVDTQVSMCATEEGAAACPSTCTGDCACMDDKDASFTKNDGKKGTCADIAALGYGKPGNGKRKKFFNKEKNAKTHLPSKCNCIIHDTILRFILYFLALAATLFLCYV